VQLQIFALQDEKIARRFIHLVVLVKVLKEISENCSDSQKPHFCKKWKTSVFLNHK